MVREMLDEDGSVRDHSSDRTAVGEDNDDSGGDSDAGMVASPTSGAQVVRNTGKRGGNTTYVGATHFMAMLGDVCVIVVLFTIPTHDGPGTLPSTIMLFYKKCQERSTAVELTLSVLRRSRISRVTLTTRKSIKKWMATHPSNSPTGIRLQCSPATGPRRGAGRTSWTCCRQSTSPTDWSCDISAHTRPHSVRRPLVPHRYLPSWSQRRALTVKVDRHCPQANIWQIGMCDPTCPRPLAHNILRDLGIWDETSRC